VILPDLKGITDSIFKLDSRIRYVAILNHRYDLLESRMREGIRSLTPEQTDLDFMALGAPLIVDAAAKLRPYCGTIKRISVRYDRVVLVFYRTAAHLVVVSLEPLVEQAILDEIGSSVRRLELAPDQSETSEDEN
jgi:hypothetical protein